MSLSRSALRTGRRWLYLSHRWTGIVLCILFAIWFVSGVVMMYVPFPSFRGPERVAGLPPIEWTKVRTSPADALASIQPKDFPSEMRLEMTGGEPVYRFVLEDGRRAVSATTGREITGVDATRAQAIASAFVHAPAKSIVPVDHDQWVVTRAYARIAPFWRIRMADDAGTDIYVSRKTGEIVQNTTAHERFWNWLGAVPHWIYFEALRVYQEPWRQTVLWTSGIGMLGAIAGIWIGILRVRIARRYRSGSVSPYVGWMKWHHIIGLVGGLFLVTWVFSGWMSMSPWGGLRDEGGKTIADRYAGAKPEFARTDLTMLARTAAGAHEVRFTWLGGRPVITAHGGPVHKRLLDGATARAFTPARADIQTLAASALPGAKLTGFEWLDRYDLYWFSTGDPRSDERPLPVWRFTFDDPAKSWLHIDPTTGELLNRSGSGSRSYRWLFSALHSFDLPWLLILRPLRDALMWLLSAAGLFISVSGVVVGWRYLRRGSASRAKVR
ncbi:PepSY domain-containing protein [Sphingomonas crocodyli]|uniref:PepSY domain-containing protein n=1 Tax=Sphingomonas crocodyli TaxID=1979270 RepID=A0A437M684_9SPHN|nr:PepSY domain-containing protein [Sphingomonas crocodyli]RVT93157.1 PepSY domain-containing protein [Sphingomonas crocodyli]